MALKGGLPVGIIVSQETEHSRVKVWGSCGRHKTFQFNELVVVDPNSSTYMEFLHSVEEEEANHERQVTLKALADDKASKGDDAIRTEQLKKFKRVILDAGRGTNAKIDSVSRNYRHSCCSKRRH